MAMISSSWDRAPDRPSYSALCVLRALLPAVDPKGSACIVGPANKKISNKTKTCGFRQDMFWNLLGSAVVDVNAGLDENVGSEVTAQGLGSPAMMPAEKANRRRPFLPQHAKKEKRKPDTSPFGARPVSDRRESQALSWQVLDDKYPRQCKMSTDRHQ